jgi:APA family basic amino acid/polyamine antiporter
MAEVREKTSSQRRLEPKPDLLRQVGLVSATALVISNMVGSGIFTTTGFLAGDLGDAWYVVGIWLAGAVVALTGAM